MPSIPELYAFNVDELKQRLRLLEIQNKPARKADIIAALEGELLSSRIEHYLEQLDDLERLALAEAVHAPDGRFSPSVFVAKHGQLPDYFQPGGYGYRGRAPSTHLALFFVGWSIPPVLKERLLPLVPRPAGFEMETLDTADLPAEVELAVSWHSPDGKKEKEALVVGEMELVARHDLNALLHMAEAGQISVSAKTQLPSAATLRRIESQLLGGDYYSPDQEIELKRYEGGPILPIRAYAWPLLLQSGGLAKVDGNKLALTPKGKRLRAKPFEEIVRELYRGWLSRGIQDEFRRIDLIKGQTSKKRPLTAVKERRESVAEILESCPQESWFSIDELFRFIRAKQFDFTLARDPWRLYVADATYGVLGEGGYMFKILEGRYLMVCLFEYLATIGMVDVAYTRPYWARDDFHDLWGIDELRFLSRYDGLRYVRLTPLGAYCLGLSETYAPPVREAEALFSVDDQLTVRLLRSADPGETLVLDHYGQALGPGEWRLSPGSLLEAMEQGHDLKLFEDFLQQGCQGPLPDAVRQLLESAGQRASALVDQGPARLLQCHSSALAKMLASESATAPHCHLAGDRLLVVPARAEKAFRQGLRRLNLLWPTQK